MDAKRLAKGVFYCLVMVGVFLLLAGCGQVAPISRIALIAPFDGEWREVGYDAYYAVKLALHEAEALDVELLALDDSGSIARAVDRAHALQVDPTIKAVLLYGFAATSAETQQALGELPALMLGYWGNAPQQDHVLALYSADLPTTLGAGVGTLAGLMADSRLWTGGEALATQVVAKTHPDLAALRIFSSGSLPDADFKARYAASGLFTPQAGLLATLSYDAVGCVLGAMQGGDVLGQLRAEGCAGLNGRITFAGRYWVEAQVNGYQWEAGQLIRQDAK